MAVGQQPILEQGFRDIFSLFACSYTIVDYKLEHYFSLTPNQPAVNNPRSFTACRTGCVLIKVKKKSSVAIVAGNCLAASTATTAVQWLAFSVWSAIFRLQEAITFYLQISWPAVQISWPAITFYFQCTSAQISWPIALVVWMLTGVAAIVCLQWVNFCSAVCFSFQDFSW